MPPPELSVVIPVRNEAPNVRQLHQELTDVLRAWGRSYELLFVEDGSTDDTFERLAEIHRRDPRVRVIRFRRNFGQTAGFAAGFAHARGRYIVTADGDLQNDPSDIPGMVEELERGGFDIVCGWRRDRKDPFFSRRMPSTIANRIISWATGVHLHDYGCSLKVFRAEVVKPMRLYGEMHRFLPAIASEMGVRISERVVSHRRREHGTSNYGISRTVRVLLDLLTVKFLISYSTRPLQIFGVLGLGMGAAGLAVLAYLGYLKYVEHEGISQRLWLPLAVLLIFTGVQLVTLGLLAELQARTYHESQDKPIYVLRDVLESPAVVDALAAEPRPAARQHV
ncbi:MAG TPA: glycosyltransferase family 2 protein [Vicinamibacterales bacterium]|jgi:glycosyltransferase involved in cell wall biosynthesis|nr:glycosyltransferase family 2 protein [Vicinamibacterales bacterium]